MRARAERGGGGCGGGDHVHVREGPLKVTRDERARLLRLSVIRVVISRRERVRPDHDAPRRLLAEAFAARLEENLPERIGLGARPIADAVEARQVGRGLRGREDVINGQRVLGVRQADLADVRAERLHLFDGNPRLFLDFGLHPLDEIFLRDADAQTA